jgi:hypothetical protein
MKLRLVLNVPEPFRNAYPPPDSPARFQVSGRTYYTGAFESSRS